ncbi:MAG TPA: hypothetical protein VFS06_03510 [Casimicrobiaceae bacterium]|nr:hypothetical protein [Casimicrobiaceae bacterium]
MTLGDVVAPILPPSWRETADRLPAGIPARAFSSAFGLRVFVTVENRGAKTGVWLHVSLSRAGKLPSWEDVREVKDIFIGRDRCAIHMVPPEKFYVNLHPYTLHLFSRLDADTVPPRLYEDQ